jgi:acetyl esterase
MPLDPQLAVLLEFIASAGHPPMHEGSPEDARKGFRALSVDTVKPEDVVPVASVEDLSAAEVPARLYRTKDARATNCGTLSPVV